MNDNDNDATRRAKARRVPEPSSGAPDESAPADAGADGSGRTRRRRSVPFWRQGRFWVAVIALEVALALVISFSFERSTTDVDLAGGDLASFCDRVVALRAESGALGASGNGSRAVTDPEPFERERDGYRSLVAVAPSDLVADLELLADLDGQIIDVVDDIAARKATDPGYSGLPELTAAVDRAAAEGRVAGSRLEVALRDGCGIDTGPNAPATNQTPTVAVPGTTGP